MNKMKEKPFVPGTDGQLKFFSEQIDCSNKIILAVGSNLHKIASELTENNNTKVYQIVEDYDSLLISKIGIGGKERCSVRLMDFENTDFRDESIDIIFAQASISSKRRAKIIKEFKRVLKVNGYLCSGEIVKHSAEIPPFVNDIFVRSNIEPLEPEELEKFYISNNFEITAKKDISDTLKDFYENGIELMQRSLKQLSDNEKTYYKKLFKKIKHEANAYLNLKGDQYFGFIVLLMKKNDGIKNEKG